MTSRGPGQKTGTPRRRPPTPGYVAGLEIRLKKGKSFKGLARMTRAQLETPHLGLLIMK